MSGLRHTAQLLPSPGPFCLLCTCDTHLLFWTVLCPAGRAGNTKHRCLRRSTARACLLHMPARLLVLQDTLLSPCLWVESGTKAHAVHAAAHRIPTPAAGCRLGQLSLKRGESTRHKVLLVEGMTPGEGQAPAALSPSPCFSMCSISRCERLAGTCTAVSTLTAHVIIGESSQLPTLCCVCSWRHASSQSACPSFAPFTSADAVYTKLQLSVNRNPKALGRSSKHVINTSIVPLEAPKDAAKP